MAYVNVKDWSVDQVTDWLKGLDNAILQYNTSFLNNGVTGHQLLNLRADDLEHLGVKLLGHQEIILEAVEHLRNFHFELDKENLQTLALKLSCAANSLFNELESVDDDSSVLQTQVMSDVHNIITTIKPLVYWLDRSPFAGDKDYIDNKTNLLQLGFEMATSAHRGIFSEKPVCTVRKICEKLSKIADHVIQEIMDPMILQPACLDLATLKKKEQELGFFILPNNHAIHQIADIKHGSPAHGSSKIEEGDEIVQVNYQTVVGWQRKKAMLLLQESPPEIVLTLKKRPRHTKVYGQIYMKPYRLPSRQRGAGRDWSARWNDSVPSPRLLPILDLPRITVSEIVDSVEIADAETELSSSDSEPPDSPMDANGRMYPLKPRPILQRRNTVTGATPTSKRPYPSIEQFWDFHKPPTCTAHSSSYNIDSANFEDDSKFLRDKSASCNVGLDLSPRPTTVIGLTHSRKNSKKEAARKRVIFQEDKDEVKKDKDEHHGIQVLGASTNLDEAKSVSATSLASLNNEPITFIDEGRDLADRTTMASDWKNEIVEEIIDAIKLKSVAEDNKPPPPVPVKDPTLCDINVHSIIRRFDERRTEAATPRVLPRAQFKRPPEIPQKPEGRAKARPAVPPRSATTRLRGKLDKSHSAPAYDLSEDGGDGRAEAVGAGAEAAPSEQTIETEVAANSPSEGAERPATDAPPKPPPRNLLDAAPKPAYPVDSPKPSPVVGTPKEAKPAFVFPDVARTEEPAADDRGAGLDVNGREDKGPSKPFEPKTASTPVAKAGPELEPEAAPKSAAPSYEIQKGGGEAKVSPTNSIVKAMIAGKCKLKKKNTLTAKRRRVAVSELSPGDIQGYLYQRLRGKHNQNVHWEKRWFVLLGNCLYGFKTKDCPKASSLVFLSGLTVAVASEVKSRSNAFKVYHTGTVFYFSADDPDALQSWIELIRAATLHHHPEPAAPKSRDSKLYSETDDEDDDDDDAAAAAGGDEEKRRQAEKADSLKKFGSLKKFASSKKSGVETPPAASGSTSLDRKWFFKSGNQPKHSLPQPTAQFRSYRKIRTAADVQSSVTTGNFTSHVPLFAPQAQNVSVPNLTADDHSDDSSKMKQKPTNFIHASNPSLCRARDSGGLGGRPQPPPDGLAGFVTLEELMIRQTEERRSNPHHLVEEAGRRAAPETAAAAACSKGRTREKSDAGSSCFGKRLGSLKKSQSKQEDFENKTATYPKTSKGYDQQLNRSLPRTHKMQATSYSLEDEADTPYMSTKSLKDRSYEMIYCPEKINDVQFATNRTLDDKMYKDAPKKAAKIKKQHSFSSGDKKSRFTSKVYDSGSGKVKLKSATQYTPMLLPTSHDPKSKPKFAFELNLDEKSQKGGGGGKLKQMFGGGGGKKEKTFLGSPKLHRAIFQKHGSGSDLSWPSSSSFSQQISMTQSTYSLENSPPAMPEQFAMSASPHADYPGLEYPPVFEPETYSLANPESSLSILRKQSKNTTP